MTLQGAIGKPCAPRSIPLAIELLDHASAEQHVHAQEELILQHDRIAGPQRTILGQRCDEDRWKNIACEDGGSEPAEHAV